MSGYTATPFANIFIDPETDDEMLGADLFPRDFIVSLDPPSNYFGPNKVFQEALTRSSCRSTTPRHLLPLGHKIDFEITALPPSLDRRDEDVRGRARDPLLRGDGTAHMSMLVNASRFVDVQIELKNHLHRHLREIESSGARRWRQGTRPSAAANPQIAALERVWRDNFSEACHELAGCPGCLARGNLEDRRAGDQRQIGRRARLRRSQGDRTVRRRGRRLCSLARHHARRAHDHLFLPPVADVRHADADGAVVRLPRWIRGSLPGLDVARRPGLVRAHHRGDRLASSRAARTWRLPAQHRRTSV